MDWNSAILWGIISLFSTIFFGFLFGYIFYKKSIKKKKLYVYVNSNILISQDLSNYNGLKVLYNNEEISTLTSSTIVITNIGNDLIEKEDIISSDPITILTSNKFLSNNIEEYTVTVSNKKVTALLQKINDSTLQLVFDFLRPKDKIIVTLLHNGTISIEGELKLGTMQKNIGYNQDAHFIKEKIFDKSIDRVYYTMKKMPILTFLFGILLYIIFIFLLYNYFSR